MVRPGMKRLQVAQRVNVQPNKTGTSAMMGRSVYINRTTKNTQVLFNESSGTPYNNLANSKTFINEYTGDDKAADISCNCVKATVYAKDTNGNIIPYK